MSALLALLVAGSTVPAMVVIDEASTMREEAPPHGAIGLSTGLAAAILACAAILRWRFIGRARQGG